MNIHDFVLTMATQLLEFKEFWIARHAIDPETNPLELSSASDWLDQFLYWEDVKDD